MAISLLVLNGPNLNLLGTRQPQVYGSTTLADVEALCRQAGERLGIGIDFRQSNHEGVLIDWIHEAKGRHAGIVLNAGALTHTSIGFLDALTAAELPVIEVSAKTGRGVEQWIGWLANGVAQRRSARQAA